MPDTDNNTEEIRRFVAQWLLEENRRTAVADFNARIHGPKVT